MTITICASLSHYQEVLDIKNKLSKKGIKVLYPWGIEEIGKGNLTFDKMPAFKLKNQSKAIIIHYNKIKKSDAILVVNEEKNGLKNYIGGNTLIEMGFAYVLKKKIYLLNPVPEVSYKEEILAMKPIVLNGTLKKILAIIF